VHSHIVRLVAAAQPRRLTGSITRRGPGPHDPGDLSPVSQVLQALLLAFRCPVNYENWLSAAEALSRWVALYRSLALRRDLWAEQGALEGLTCSLRM